MSTPYYNEIVYGVYARKSSESEDKQVQSIERQIDELTETAQRNNLASYKPYITEKQSAFSPGREGFANLVKLTNEGKINAWLCYHANRLSRNSVDAGAIIYLMDQGHLDHIRTPSKVYYNNPTDKMMLQIEFTMSKKDSDDKSVFVKSGLNKRYKKGLPNGKAPIGFLNDKTGEKGDRQWLLDEEKFDKLKLLFSQFLKGNDSISTITDFAREQLLLKTPQHKRQGGKLVTRSLVERILKNPVYAGFFYSKDAQGEGRTKRTLHLEIPRILCEQEHLYILEMLRSRTTPKEQRHQSVYSRFLKGKNNEKMGADHKFQLICDCRRKFAYRNVDCCPGCGVPIDLIQRPKYLSYTYYYNLKRRKTKGVTAKCIEEKKVESFIQDYVVKNMHLSPRFVRWIKLHLMVMRKDTLEQKKLLDRTIEDDKASIEKRKQKLRELYSKGLINDKDFASDYQRLEQEQQNLKPTSRPMRDYFSEMEQLLEVCLAFLKVIRSGNPDHKKELLSNFRSNLTWDEEKLEIIRPKWIEAFEMMRKHILAKYGSVEPELDLIGQGKNARLKAVCPTLLQWLDRVRTYLIKE